MPFNDAILSFSRYEIQNYNGKSSLFEGKTVLFSRRLDLNLRKNIPY
jgi:hypothetical protein